MRASRHGRRRRSLQIWANTEAEHRAGIDASWHMTRKSRQTGNSFVRGQNNRRCSPGLMVRGFFVGCREHHRPPHLCLQHGWSTSVNAPSTKACGAMKALPMASTAWELSGNTAFQLHKRCFPPTAMGPCTTKGKCTWDGSAVAVRGWGRHPHHGSRACSRGPVHTAPTANRRSAWPEGLSAAHASLPVQCRSVPYGGVFAPCAHSTNYYVVLSREHP